MSYFTIEQLKSTNAKRSGKKAETGAEKKADVRVSTPKLTPYEHALTTIGRHGENAQVCGDRCAQALAEAINRGLKLPWERIFEAMFKVSEGYTTRELWCLLQIDAIETEYNSLMDKIGGDHREIYASMRGSLQGFALKRCEQRGKPEAAKYQEIGGCWYVIGSKRHTEALKSLGTQTPKSNRSKKTVKVDKDEYLSLLDNLDVF